jgi:adenine-specific DNA-methyltransferase
LRGGGLGGGEVGSIDAVGTVTPTLTLPRQGGGDDFVDWKRELSALAPTEKNTKRTLLEKHLNDYTAKYSFDYFIHKDLGGFMRRELDFFIKNEILFIDDLDADHVKATISKVKVIKEIGHKVITFLEQLENFQKKLWLKKKFVVDTGYCSTLDKVPEFLLPAISENYEQICEWIKLGFIEESEVEGLKKWLEEEKSEGGRVKGETDLFGNPVSTSFTPHSSPFTFLVLDTVFFNQEFSEKLLASFDNLDEATDGLLVHSENFQALNLLLERFQGQIKCTYIDPPYNTDGDDFIYKDSYQHSSWLSMMNDRLVLGRRGLPIDGVFITSIGREELFRLEQLCSSIFGEENRVGDLIWEKGRKNDAKFFSLGHDYFLVYVKSKEHLTSTGTIWREEKPGAAEILAEYRKLKHQFGTDYSAIQEGIRKFYTSLPKAHLSLKHRRYNRVDKNGIWRDDNISWPGGNGPRYDVIHPETNLPCKVPERGWAFAAIEKFKLYEQHGFIEYREDHNDPPMLKRYLNYVSTDFDPDARRRNISDSGEEEEANVQVMPSVIYKNQQPTVVELRNILGGEGFKNPKDPSVLARLFSYVSNRNDVILDFFAGSGTSGHAVISQNREDNGNRKYILVEMGEHFDAVLKPRIQKVIYSKDWKDGKPVSRQGSSHLFKYIRLESYEDALNNLQLKRTHEQGSLLEQHDMLREQYMLSYMLDVESAGSTSLLNIAAFADPFGYRMNIARGNETKETVVDLVETFNWLLGIKVLRISQKEYRAAEFEADAEGRLQIAGRARTCGTGEGWTFQEVEGQTLSGDKVLVIWRTLTDKQEQDNLMLDTWFGKRNYNTLDFEFSRIYVNGDNNLENLKIGEERWKVALIEQEFKKLMFEMQE